MLKSFLLMGLIIIKVIDRSLSINTVWCRIADRLWPHLTSFQNPPVLMVTLTYYLIKAHLWQSSAPSWLTVTAVQLHFLLRPRSPLPRPHSISHCASDALCLSLTPSHPHTSARAIPLPGAVGKEDFSLPSLVQFLGPVNSTDKRQINRQKVSVCIPKQTKNS